MRLGRRSYGGCSATAPKYIFIEGVNIQEQEPDHIIGGYGGPPDGEGVAKDFKAMLRLLPAGRAKRPKQRPSDPCRRKATACADGRRAIAGEHANALPKFESQPKSVSEFSCRSPWRLSKAADHVCGNDHDRAGKRRAQQRSRQSTAHAHFLGRHRRTERSHRRHPGLPLSARDSGGKSKCARSAQEALISHKATSGSILGWVPTRAAWILR